LVHRGGNKPRPRLTNPTIADRTDRADHSDPHVNPPYGGLAIPTTIADLAECGDCDDRDDRADHSDPQGD
jgi:hypothetical protein